MTRLSYDRPERAKRSEIDTATPSSARLYDALLGGKDNFEVDREVSERLQELAPGLTAAAVEHRRWISRAVKFMTLRAGIDQLLDCGSGLPTKENTHQVAHWYNRDARIVYFDNDPLVEAHGRLMLEENDNCHFFLGDLTKVDEVLSHPTVVGNLDFNRPVGIIHGVTLGHVEDLDEARSVMAKYVEALAPGSMVAISHHYDPADGGELSALARRIEDDYRAAVGQIQFRTKAEVESLFAGLDVLDPGLVPQYDWWPDGPNLGELSGIISLCLVGVGVKR